MNTEWPGDISAGADGRIGLPALMGWVGKTQSLQGLLSNENTKKWAWVSWVALWCLQAKNLLWDRNSHLCDSRWGHPISS